MTIDDPDWLKCFGHNSSEIEPKPKGKPAPLERHQFEAALILAKPHLFGFGEQPVQTTETPTQTTSIGTTTSAVLMPSKSVQRRLALQTDETS